MLIAWIYHSLFPPCQTAPDGCITFLSCYYFCVCPSVISRLALGRAVPALSAAGPSVSAASATLTCGSCGSEKLAAQSGDSKKARLCLCDLFRWCCEGAGGGFACCCCCVWADQMSSKCSEGNGCLLCLLQSCCGYLRRRVKIEDVMG